jgi:SAM-dependent methyltransferase
MNILRKSRTAIDVLREGGLPRVVDILHSKYGLPIPPKIKWRAGISSEMQFWDDFIRCQTHSRNPALWYRNRLDPDFPLDPRPEALLPPEKEVHILDVGAGPLTSLGKKSPGRVLKITALDALADEYDKILHRYGVQPLIRTQLFEAEKLTERYSANTFDLCFAQNSLDHAYNPEQSILQMIDVVKKGRYVLLEHFANEAESVGYTGLHQWNFDLSPDGDFLIRSKSNVTNMTQKYAGRCTISCELLSERWLVTRILKR